MEEGPRAECAGFVSRLAAMAVDVTLITALVALVELVGGTVDELARGVVPFRVSLPALLLAAMPFLVVAYFALCWSFSGQTVGKWLLGLRVVGPDGEPPSLTRALVRALSYPLSGMLLGLGFFWVLVDPKRRGFHDRLAGTFVVYAGPVRRLSLPAR